ncbi:MAG: NlpC/P60 family protein [Atopobiaceae bacterium]|nr:NlpC/P60 family protein [Atopobiaceae bacterium]
MTDDNQSVEETYTNMYRLYNPNSGEHFYTGNLDEARAVAQAGWRWEGVGWVSPEQGEEVYRLYNPNAGDHHYTTNAVERDNLVQAGWNFEGVGWHSGGNQQVYREYNPNATAGTHNFTTNTSEHDTLVGVGWHDEGLAWRASETPWLPIDGFWLICSSWGSCERYWVAGDGKIAEDRLVTPEEGAGYYAYAKPQSGAVLRGALDQGNGTVMLADNDGRLAQGTGFVNSSAYGASNQLYLLAATDKGYSIACSGLFEHGDDHFWGLGGSGAILTGKLVFGNIMLIAAHDTGRLEWTQGWVITDVYDSEIQRYFFCRHDSMELYGARLGLFSIGENRYYGREDQGYVVRSGYAVSQYYGPPAEGDGDLYHDDVVMVADNDGILLTREQIGQLLVAAARSQMNAPYDEEGSAYQPDRTKPGWGFNCSGFTWWVYSTLGLNISHNQGYYSYYTGTPNKTDSQMWGVEKRGAWKTSVADLVPGDLVFFSSIYDKWHTGHVGIYIGDGLMIDCNTSAPSPGGVQVRSVYKSTFVGGGLPVTLV